MTTTVLAPYLTSQFFGNNGAFLSGGQLFTYQAGTVTPTPTYLDSTGVTPNTNPIVLNSRGECSIWLLPNVGYKFVLQDSSGNPIWTRDQVTQSQLLTLYAGVDTGVANAYVVNFTANFTAYTDGIVLYFIPANSNAGASTINVNGLGVIPIINQNGTALASNELLSNQVATIMYKGGSFLLIQGAQQGLVSYGGLDTGIANAYVVALTNQYFAYQAGNILFFIPNHTNTGPSTINVKNLGPISISSANGGTLVGGELIQAQLVELIVINSISVQIVSPSIISGSFNFASVTGGTGGGTPLCNFVRNGNQVSISIPLVSVTSTATTFALTGYANYLQGITSSVTSPLFPAVDNTVSGISAYLSIPNQISGSTVTININNASGNWTAAGTKSISNMQFTYIAK